MMRKERQKRLRIQQSCLEHVVSTPAPFPWIPVSTGMTVLFVSYLRKQVSRPTGQDGVSFWKDEMRGVFLPALYQLDVHPASDHRRCPLRAVERNIVLWVEQPVHLNPCSETRCPRCRQSSTRAVRLVGRSVRTSERPFRIGRYSGMPYVLFVSCFFKQSQ